MKAPQITMIVLMALGFGVVLSKNGQPHKGNYSVVTSAVSTAITLAILIWGGFFDGSAS